LYLSRQLMQHHLACALGGDLQPAGARPWMGGCGRHARRARAAVMRHSNAHTCRSLQLSTAGPQLAPVADAESSNTTEPSDCAGNVMVVSVGTLRMRLCPSGVATCVLCSTRSDYSCVAADLAMLRPPRTRWSTLQGGRHMKHAAWCPAALWGGGWEGGDSGSGARSRPGPFTKAPLLPPPKPHRLLSPACIRHSSTRLK